MSKDCHDVRTQDYVVTSDALRDCAPRHPLTPSMAASWGGEDRNPIPGSTMKAAI